MVGAGVVCGVGPLERASAMRVAIGRSDLVFRVAARPDLMGGGSREALVGMDLLCVGWHPVVAGGEVQSVVISPPRFHIGDVLGALVAFSIVWRAVPQQQH
jgi:hypothetical protein